MDGRESSPTQEKGERRDARANRRRLLDAAKHLFSEQGVGSTNMKDVARAAGVGQGTLYRHFAHKGELCWALIREDIAEFQDRIGAAIADPLKGSPLGRLDLLIVERIRIMESHLPLFATIEEATGAARSARTFRGPFETWTHEKIVGLLSEAVAAGEAAELDAPFTADALLASTTPPLYQYQRHECGYSIERVVEGARWLFIEGLSLEKKRCFAEIKTDSGPEPGSGGVIE